MTNAFVVLALDTGLDVQAARRLGDYRQLDDQALTSALEQVHVQRSGPVDWPPHLRAVRRLVAIIDDGRTVERRVFEAGEDEARALRALFAAWPGKPVEAIAWRASDARLLAARAFCHDIALPAGWRDDAAAGLAEALGYAAGEHADRHSETELMRVLRDDDATDEAGDRLAARATRRYRLWLRWLAGLGAIDAAERARREAMLNTATPERA